MHKPLLKKGHTLIPHDQSDDIYDSIDYPKFVAEFYESNLFTYNVNCNAFALTFHYIWYGEYTQSEGIELQYDAFFEDETTKINNDSNSTYYKRIIKE